VPLPPKYAEAEFLGPEFFQKRGKLDVPRERFITFSDVGAPAWGWNGWRDLARATAQVDALEEVRNDPVSPLPRPSHDAPPPRRCVSTLGLWSSLDDVRRWVGADEHEELQSFAQEACAQNACPCPLVARWQLWAKGKLEIVPPAAAEAPTEGVDVTLDEQAGLLTRLALVPAPGLTPQEMAGWFPGTAERLGALIESLVASGHLVAAGTGKRVRYARSTRRP
jgi:hypothetical protein